jgi:hypothetical protein
MNCEQSRNLWIEYLGEEIRKEDGGQLRQHLLGCPNCRKELSALHSTQNVLREGWPEEPIPQPLTFQVESHPVLPPRRFWGLGELPAFLQWPLTVTVSFCLCVLALALTKTSFEFSQGQLALSFGSKTVFSPRSISSGQSALSLEQVRQTVEQTLSQNQKMQEIRWQQLLNQAGSDWNSKRQANYETVAGRLKYLESTQNVVWKETIQNKSYVESLARDLYLRTGQARANQP